MHFFRLPWSAAACLLIPVAGFAQVSAPVTAVQMPLELAAAFTPLLEAAGTPTADADAPTTITVPAGSALFLKTSKTVNLKRGTAIEGELTRPLYIYDRMVLPAGTVLHGTVSGAEPLHGTLRTQALLNGDVTPLKTPVLRFDHVLTPSGEIALVADASPRDIKAVRFVTADQRAGLWKQATGAIHDRFEDTKAIFGPGKKDRAMKMIYSQMPYHPQRVWGGSTFIASVAEPAELPADDTPRAEVAAQTTDMLQNIHVQARLVSGVSSDTAKRGDAVTAVLTQPFFDADHRLLLPEGTRLAGSVMQTKQARSFGRNGQLRFLFQTVERPGEQAQRAYGTVKSAEGEGAENLSMDSEGGMKANPEGGRFLAPIVLGALTATSLRGRHEGTARAMARQTIAANGFGIVARVVSLTADNAAVAGGFGAYSFAKSIYFRWIARGQPVAFAQDTPLEVQLQTR